MASIQSRRKKPLFRTKSSRAGLVFPVGRVKRYLRSYSERISDTAAIYFTGVLEYICAEMLENTGSITKDLNKKIIIPRHINLFIKDDEEIDELLSDVTIPSVGVRPYIHKALFQPRYKDKNKSNSVR